MKLLQTPRSLWVITGLAAFVYVTAPLENFVFYRTELSRGAYLPDADSIAIPIYAFTMALLCFAPVYALCAWLALRKYVGGRPIWDFDTSRWLRSTIWTLVYGGFAAYNLYEAGRSVLLRMPVSVAASVFWAYLFLCVRASLAGRT